MREKPDLVQRFVDASIEGWYSYLYGDPAPANALIKRDNPEMTDASARLRHRQDQGIRHCRQRRRRRRRDRRDDRGALARFLRARWRVPASTPRTSISTRPSRCSSSNKKVGCEALTQTLPQPADAPTATDPLVALRGVGKRFASGIEALRGDRPGRRAAASSSACSAPRAAARVRCCASLPG